VESADFHSLQRAYRRTFIHYKELRGSKGEFEAYILLLATCQACLPCKSDFKLVHKLAVLTTPCQFLNWKAAYA